MVLWTKIELSQAYYFGTAGKSREEDPFGMRRLLDMEA